MKKGLRVVLLATLTGSAFAVDRPIEGDRLRLRDPVNVTARSFRFRAASDLAIDPTTAADPRSVGATVEITGRGAGDGSSGVVQLGQGNWTGLGNPPGSKGYKWVDPARTDGVKTVVFGTDGSGGKLVVSGGGSSWDYAIGQAQAGPVDVRFAVGPDVYCASFSSFQKNQAHTVLARFAPPPPDCALPPPPACPNGTVDGTEECDDNNSNPGDGCSPTCQLESGNPAVCAGVPSVSGTALDSVLVAGGLEAPVHVTAPRLDPSRLFIVEQPGRIRIVKNGVPLGTPFLAIEGPVMYGGEQGLLSVAFHPDYETNGQFFVYYVNNAGDLVIARYLVSGNPDLADAGSEHILLTIPHPVNGNHNGGNLTFGPDGFLYAGIGDGGSGCDPSENAQNDLSMLGKLLRINVAAETSAIWAKGLRNPWRLSFDRGTGDLYIADVGQNQWEEVNVDPAPVASGVNYGWDFYEARHCSSDAPSSCADPCPAPGGFTMPVLEYNHGQGCSITGGFVYRGCRMPDLAGTYFYSDICTAFIKTFKGVVGGDAQNLMDRTADLDPAGPPSIGGVSSFGEDTRGELYIVDYGNGAAGQGEVYKIVPGS